MSEKEPQKQFGKMTDEERNQILKDIYLDQMQELIPDPEKLKELLEKK